MTPDTQKEEQRQRLVPCQRHLCRKLRGGSIIHLAHSCAPEDDSVHEDAQMGLEQRTCFLDIDILLSFTKDQTKKEAVISCMEKLFDTVQRRFMEHFIYAAYAFIESAEHEDGFRKKNQKFTSAVVSPSSFCFSPLINLALHGLSEFPDDFVHCVVLVTVTCLFFYEDPAAFALLVRFHTKDKLENFKGSALEALHKYSTQIILLGGINQTDSELKSPQLSLS